MTFKRGVPFARKHSHYRQGALSGAVGLLGCNSTADRRLQLGHHLCHCRRRGSSSAPPRIRFANAIRTWAIGCVGEVLRLLVRLYAVGSLLLFDVRPRRKGQRCEGQRSSGSARAGWWCRGLMGVIEREAGEKQRCLHQ